MQLVYEKIFKASHSGFSVEELWMSDFALLFSDPNLSAYDKKQQQKKLYWSRPASFFPSFFFLQKQIHFLMFPSFSAPASEKGPSRPLSVHYKQPPEWIQAATLANWGEAAQNNRLRLTVSRELHSTWRPQYVLVKTAH